ELTGQGIGAWRLRKPAPQAISLTWLTVPPRTETVLENFDLLGHRDVVPLLVYALLAEAMLLAEVRGRAEVRKCEKVSNHMRLVEIPTVHGYLRPVRCCGLPNQAYRPMKALDPVEQFRGDADFGDDDLDAPSVAEADTPSPLVDRRAALHPLKGVERGAHGMMVLQRPKKTGQ